MSIKQCIPVLGRLANQSQHPSAVSATHTDDIRSAAQIGVHNQCPHVSPSTSLNSTILRSNPQRTVRTSLPQSCSDTKPSGTSTSLSDKQYTHSLDWNASTRYYGVVHCHSSQYKTNKRPLQQRLSRQWTQSQGHRQNLVLIDHQTPILCNGGTPTICWSGCLLWTLYLKSHRLQTLQRLLGVRVSKPHNTRSVGC